MELFIAGIMTYLCSIPLLLSLIIGILHFARVRKNRFNLVFAVFSLKPVLITPIWAMLVIRALARQTGNEEIALLKCALPAITYTIVAAGLLWLLSGENRKIFWAMIVMDTVRMAFPTVATIVNNTNTKLVIPGFIIYAWIIGMTITAGVAIATLIIPIEGTTEYR